MTQVVAGAAAAIEDQGQSGVGRNSADALKQRT